MKKTVIIILAILPIVLLFTIAFAGRIVSLYQHIPVENVSFINAEGVPYTALDLLSVEVGDTHALSVRVHPDIASDKSVTYTVGDEAICRVDRDGVLTGVSVGETTVVVRTKDSGKTAILQVRVKADRVSGITLPAEELTLTVGEPGSLTASVLPSSALNKAVSYTSSAPEICSVDANGNLLARAAGEAVITAVTADGGKTATCRVTVNAGTPPIYFDFSSAPSVSKGEAGYITTESYLVLSMYLRVDPDRVAAADVRFEILSGASTATLDENGTLAFTGRGVVTVRAYVGDPASPTYRAEIRIALF